MFSAIGSASMSARSITARPSPLRKLAEPLMRSGGCLLAVTFYGAEKVVQHYGVMGPVKAALETAVEYMAVELGDEKIRVNAISPGLVATRSASGLSHFDETFPCAYS